MKFKTYIFLGIVLLIAGTFFVLKAGSVTGFAALDTFEEEIPFYKSFSCGCCSIHAGYLSGKGNLDVDVKEMDNVDPIKNTYKIPSQMQSCHTAIFGDYFVEGHIPLEAINKLLEEKPDIAGIAMPGMPSGSPGMPGRKYGDFVIYAIKKDGSYEEFMRI